jgi:flagellar protein FliS
MDANAREQYLSSQILTATPERLHVMLIDGAVRFATQLGDALACGDFERATNIGERCRDVLAEMLLCVERNANEAAARLRSIYTFLIREVADAQLRRQSGRVDGVLAVLAIERDTWSQLCEQLGPREFRRDAQHADTAAPTFGSPTAMPVDLPSEPFSMRA